MKKTDYALIALIAGGSLLISYFVANSLPMFKQGLTPYSVKTATSISSEVDKVDSRIFDQDSINPTVEIYIGNQNTAFDDVAGATNTDNSK